MQWWGNFGSAAAGITALAGVVLAALGVPKIMRAIAEQAEERERERRRGLHGWSRTGVNTYNVAFVTAEAEQELALKAIRNGGQTDYVVLRMLGGPRQAGLLERLLSEDPYIARRPTPGEFEALEIGLKAQRIPLAAYEQVRGAD